MVNDVMSRTKDPCSSSSSSLQQPTKSILQERDLFEVELVLVN